MIERNIMVITNTEAQMQGVIRGIESLDSQHKIGIIHGTYGKDAVDEVTLILAELANALIIKTPNITLGVHPQGKAIASMDIVLPDEAAQDNIIKIVTEEYGPRLITEILN